jgi:hypothetical protein
MNEDHILICFHCCEMRDMPSESAVKRFGKTVLYCCDEHMYRFERNKMYVLVKNMDVVKDKLEKEIVESFGVEQ